MSDVNDSGGHVNRSALNRFDPAVPQVPVTHDLYRQIGAYGAKGPDAPGSLRLVLVDYWRIVNKRRWVVLGILAAVFVLGALRTLMTTPLYAATVRLQIDRNATRVVEGGNIAPFDGYDFDFQRTQIELMQSRAMAERVVSALKLGEDADLFKRTEFSIVGALTSLLRGGATTDAQGGSRSGRESAAVGLVMGNRSVRPVSGSRLVDISYSDPNPARAQRVANAFADAFVAANLDKRFQANAYAKSFLEDQLKQVKLRLEESDKVLLEFAQKEQIVTATEKSTIAENNLATANATLSSLATERIRNEQLWRQAEPADAVSLPQFLTNSVIAGLRDKQIALVAIYQEKLQTFKPNYPAMIEIKSKINEIDRLITNEVRIIKESLKAAYENSANQEAEMNKRIANLRAEVLDLQKRSIQYNLLKRDVDTNRSLYDGLLQRYKEVDVASAASANNVFVVDRAGLPGAPYSPQTSRALLLSFALGLGAGIAVAFVLDRLDDTVRFTEEMEQISGLVTLGLIPKMDEGKTIETELADPRSGLSEAYRSLGTALQFATPTGLPKTLFVTSAGPSEGKSTTALGVARHFATMGLRVLVVDADLRNPSLHLKLGLANDIGLSNYLTGACTPPEAAQLTATRNLTFMASGPLPPNAPSLLGNSRFLSLLSVGLQVFDLIVIDGPPVMGLADAPMLSSAAAATVFVVGAGQARTGPVRGAVKRLELARAALIGTVLTKFDTRNAGYGYGYGCEYGYGKDGHTYAQSVGSAAGHQSPLTNLPASG
jgi:polysaccharide biosynthesis transport protein